MLRYLRKQFLGKKGYNGGKVEGEVWVLEFPRYCQGDTVLDLQCQRLLYGQTSSPTFNRPWCEGMDAVTGSLHV